VNKYKTQQVVSEPMVCGLGKYNLTLYQKSSWRKFWGNVSHISVWTAVQVKGRLLPLEGKCINMEERLSLGGEIVRYSSVSLSSTLCRNEKVEQYIAKKSHKFMP